MNQTITIDESKKVSVLQHRGYQKEEIKMSLISMAMNLGHFNINVSIKKDEERKREILRRNIEHDKRINEALENRNNMLFNFNNNIF